MPDVVAAAQTSDESAPSAATPVLPTPNLPAVAANDPPSASFPTGRRRMPTVGPSITQRGAPSLTAWASALSLGDLEDYLRKAVA